MKLKWFGIALTALVPTFAHAAPGVGEKVYGATVDAGVTEVEARYGRLTGGAADGEDALVVELAHGFSRHFYAAILGEFARDSGARRTVEAVAVEAIAPLGRIDSLGVDVALYGEYEHGRGDGLDKIELKGLFEHAAGGFDGRLNLIAERDLAHGAPVAFGYAASADWAVVGELRAGIAAFGEFGNTEAFGGRQEHFAGPVIKAELEHLPGNSELGIEAGWLRAFGAARDEAGGQARLLLEWEFRF